MKCKLYIKIFIPTLVILFIISSFIFYQNGLITYAKHSLVGYFHFYSTIHHYFESLPSNDLHDKLLLSKKLIFLFITSASLNRHILNVDMTYLEYREHHVVDMRMYLEKLQTIITLKRDPLICSIFQTREIILW